MVLFTDRFEIVEIYLNLVPLTVRYLLQLVHVLEFGLVARLCCVECGIVRVVDHVILVLVLTLALAIKVEAL